MIWYDEIDFNTKDYPTPFPELFCGWESELAHFTYKSPSNGVNPGFALFTVGVNCMYEVEKLLLGFGEIYENTKVWWYTRHDTKNTIQKLQQFST